MPKKRRTAKQKAASKRNLVKARAARKKGTPVGKSGMIKLYHHTNDKAAKAIVKSQTIRGGGDLADRVFFSNIKGGLASDWGKNVVSVRISKKKIGKKRQGGYGNTKEFYYSVPTKALAGTKIRRERL